MKKIISIIILTFTITLNAQVENNSLLTIDQIMQAEKFIGYAPTD
ncbi:MAG: hypothetical protein ACI863_000359, partial [Flavobacteriales bacterium]